MAETLIKISGVRKEYKVEAGPNVVALNGVDLEIKRNEFICVVGPSGCGKTTLLNIIAGLEPFDSGSVTMHGEEIIGPGPDRGVIFQQYALFPWMTVRRNIEYGLKFQEKMFTDEEKSELVSHYIKMVNLEGFENSYPKALSGGMKQRVAIARGYALNPEVLLMDEPFGALDAQTRAQLQEDLLHTWESEKKTAFFITHDVDEAVLLATRVVIMSARPGQIKEIVDINLPYPRTQATKMEPEFIRLKNYIWDAVYKMYLEIPK
ncbi:MAG: ABC transporter ATP-binding protein [Candidatus Treponema excrementipullorum]|nr:ABC transporter ATP-binding protein [Spirochaetia bacterium]MCI7589979.1 ABC transporter ATP-binding protein [Spirochaetia bacterium]MDY4465890.1 ABC transporter ATP-binding protein [Candidatus Treponema excrementipullorum]